MVLTILEKVAAYCEMVTSGQYPFNSVILLFTMFWLKSTTVAVYFACYHRTTLVASVYKPSKNRLPLILLLSPPSLTKSYKYSARIRQCPLSREIRGQCPLGRLVNNQIEDLAFTRGKYLEAVDGHLWLADIYLARSETMASRHWQCPINIQRISDNVHSQGK